MTLLLSELCEQLKKIDEISLLERLDISSEELVEYFKDKIEDNYDALVQEFNEGEDEVSE